MNYDWFKMMHGKTIEDVGREIPSVQNTVDRIVKETKSRYGLRLLGISANGHEYISEEERYINFHILGAPGEGKSKFLEYHIRKDIDMGNGLCLIDPSDKGDTARNVLNYCAKIGYEKVIWIDPKYYLGLQENSLYSPAFSQSRKTKRCGDDGVFEYPVRCQIYRYAKNQALFIGFA